VGGMLEPMHLAGLGRTLVVGAAVVGSVVGCGSTATHSSADAGASGSASGGGGTSGNAKAGAASGGTTAPGTAGKSSAGSAGAPPEVLTEADPDEPCDADPLATHWTETDVELSGGPNLVFALGAGGPLAVVLAIGVDGMIARTSTAGGPWTDQVTLPGSQGGVFPERVDVSSDGSTAVALWQHDQGMFFNLLQADGSFGPAVELDMPQNVEVLPLSGQRVLFGHGSSQGIQLTEYTPAGGLVPATPILANYGGMSRVEDDDVAVFSASSLVAGADALYPYKFGEGFGASQPIMARAKPPSAWQAFFFGFPNGHVARLTRILQDPVTRGLSLTTRQAGDWSAEELVTRFEGSVTGTPALGYTQDRLLLAWEDEEAHVGVVREQVGGAWQPEQVLPRSRALQQTRIASGKTTALVLGEQDLPDEKVSVKKLYRRGSDGTWYCPKLLPNGFSGELASDGEGFWFADRHARLHLWHFEP
jgi:hypothetical protein